ncbi:MAG: hypothetical protein KC561_08720, partial [Myxococcales bacterium]|nr:hypothetical protein [Myxococcales bacterium]
DFECQSSTLPTGDARAFVAHEDQPLLVGTRGVAVYDLDGMTWTPRTLEFLTSDSVEEGELALRELSFSPDSGVWVLSEDGRIWYSEDLESPFSPMAQVDGAWGLVAKGNDHAVVSTPERLLLVSLPGINPNPRTDP